jgi:hypothetical protein
MSKYPDFVKQFRPKGTVVKKQGDTFYVYEATSKRVPGKSYPVQVLKGIRGTIDETGFHTMTRAVVDTETVVIRECGFTNFLLMFEKEYVSRRSDMGAQSARNVYRSMIVYLSPSSYLNDEIGTRIMDADTLVERYKIGIPNQVTAISKLCEYKLDDLEPLKSICSVRFKEKRFESTLTKAQIDLLGRLGIEENDIRKK